MIDWRQEVIDLRRDFCGGRDRALATRPSLTTEHDVTTDRVFLRLGLNSALGVNEHEWFPIAAAMRSVPSTQRS